MIKPLCKFIEATQCHIPEINSEILINLFVCTYYITMYVAIQTLVARLLFCELRLIDQSIV